MTKAIACWSALTILVGACASRSAEGHGEDVAAIKQATVEWAAAFARGDVAGAAAFMTPAARLVPPSEPVVSGAAAIQAWAGSALSAMPFESVASTIDSVRVAGDWAVSRGSWSITMLAEGTTVSDTSRYVVIWERQADGSWKAAYDIWDFGHPAGP